MMRNEVHHFAGGKKPNRFVSLGNSILGQRSYYPNFPAPKGTSLDLQFWKKLQMPCAPDVLISPSRLIHLAKRIGVPGQDQPLAKEGETLLLNPGKLTKINGGGTFARLWIRPMLESDIPEGVPDDEDAEVPHFVASRTRCEIVRI